MSDYWISETTNGNVIRRVVMHPDVKPYLFLDEVENHVPINLKELAKSNLTIYQMRIGLKLAGLVFFKSWKKSAEIDVAFLPEFRGKKTKQFANELFNSYIKKTKIRLFTAKIRRKNRRSLAFVKWFGFKVYRSDDNYHYVSKFYG